MTEKEFEFLDDAKVHSKKFDDKRFDTVMVRIAVVGAAGSGKTSLLARVLTGKFGTTGSTIGVDFMLKRMWCRDGRHLKLQLFDISGDDRYVTNSFASFLHRADAAVLVYDLADAESTKRLDSWKERIDEDMPETRLVAVVGNKLDLLEDEKAGVAECRFLEQKAREYEAGPRSYFTSAKTGVKCERVFYELAMAVLDDRLARGLSEGDETTVQLGNPTPKNKKCCS